MQEERNDSMSTAMKTETMKISKRTLDILKNFAGINSGILVNEGTLLGAPFTNQIIHCDAGPRTVRAYPVKPDGAGYTAEMVDILNLMESVWIFVLLLVLTGVTVGVSYLHLSIGAAVGVALLVASIKGTMVACYFMHLISERKLIYAVLALTVVFFLALLFLPIATTADGVVDDFIDLGWSRDAFLDDGTEEVVHLLPAGEDKLVHDEVIGHLVFIDIGLAVRLDGGRAVPRRHFNGGFGDYT
jgi:caa(3)-type oxidase subunit IV